MIPQQELYMIPLMSMFWFSVSAAAAAAAFFQRRVAESPIAVPANREGKGEGGGDSMNYTQGIPVRNAMQRNTMQRRAGAEVQLFTATD